MRTRTKNKAMFISEEIKYKNGHTYIKREVKEGKEARKEIEKRLDTMCKPLRKLFEEML